MQPGQSVMVIRADDEKGRKGRSPYDRCLGRSRSLKDLLRAPPRRECDGNDRRARTNL